MPRFEFGRNWRSFLGHLDEERIREAESSLLRMLGVGSLDGASFLDVGSGSGIFSLAARRLGARVCSFDYDPESVACTRELKRRYSPNDPEWRVEHGSVLDERFMGSLGRFDIVYAWGVLHHTGEMWRALEIVGEAVSREGILYLSIYNDQGPPSRVWRRVKRAYNRSPFPLRFLLVLGVGAYFELRAFIGRLLEGRNPSPIRRWREKKKERGMSVWHDLIDWVGGYPFQVAKPEEVFHFLRDHGFALIRLKTCGGRLGCNEFVFVRAGSSSHAPRRKVQSGDGNRLPEAE